MFLPTKCVGMYTEKAWGSPWPPFPLSHHGISINSAYKVFFQCVFFSACPPSASNSPNHECRSYDSWKHYIWLNTMSLGMILSSHTGDFSDIQLFAFLLK